MSTPKQPKPSLEAQGRAITKLKVTLGENRIYAYRAEVGPFKPTWYQKAIHQGGKTSVGKGSVSLGRVAKERWCFMPNQVGKSLGGAADDVMQAYGIHPDIDTPVPNLGVILTVSHLKSVQIMRRLIWEFIPKADQDRIMAHKDGCGFFNQNVEKPSRLVLPNGSQIHFMSADQDAMEFESLTLNWFHSDEEMPEEIYNQIQIRLLRHHGNLICTMTPWQEEGTAGISWTADRILNNEARPEGERSGEVWIAPSITMYDAPWLSKEAVEEWKKKVTSPEEYDARFKGIHMQRSGKIFNTYKDKHFNPKNLGESGHLLPENFPLNPSWSLMSFLDPSSPAGITGCLWVAVTTPCVWQGTQFKANELIFFREYKEKDLTVKQHAGNILGITGKDLLVRKFMDGRFMNQKADANTGASYADLYEKSGLWCEPWMSTLIQAEIDSTKMYIQGVLDRSSTQPGIFILQGLHELRREIDRYIYPFHRSGELKGERKYVQHKKSKGICLVDCMKAACNLDLKPMARHWEEDLDFSKFQNPVTGY
jgi:hypothetical protein